MWTAWLMAALLCSAAPAQDRDAGASAATATQRADAGPVVRNEDADLLKDLALLERLELLKNLELFEPEKPVERKDGG